MRDRTVTRASRHGARTVPIEHGKPAAPKPGHEPINPDEWAEIIHLARQQRTEEAITAYARKRTA
jgi:hypothetical protein